MPCLSTEIGNLVANTCTVSARLGLDIQTSAERLALGPPTKAVLGFHFHSPAGWANSFIVCPPLFLGGFLCPDFKMVGTKSVPTPNIL